MSSKVGIPRALMYHYYYPMWKAFFDELDIEFKLSPNTNKKIINQGVKISVDDICLPFKVYYGHVLELKDKVDYLFIPRFVSLGNNNYVCPKFMGLPDMIRANIKGLPKIIEPVIDLRKGFMPVRKIAREIGDIFNKGFWEVESAYRKAIKLQNKFEKIQTESITFDDAINIVFNEDNKINKLSNLNKHTEDTGYSEKNKLKIAVLGHAYIINDNYISMDIIKHLRDMGLDVSTVEMYEHSSIEGAAALQSKKLFWYFNRKVMGTAYHLLSENSDIDGIVQVTAFGCGPDSLVKELVDIKGKRNNVSILNINIDEHSGAAGLITRLEAFVDLLERRKLA